MGKSTTIILAAVGLGGLGYFLYKKGLFSNTITETKLVTPTPPPIPTTPIVVNPDDSAAIAAAKKAKELADAELAKLQEESLKMKLAIEVEKARLAKLLNDINAEAAVRLAATSEAQRVRLAQLEAERQAAMESENVRLGRIEYDRLQGVKLELIERARVREAILEAERLEKERLLNNNTPIKTTFPIKEEVISVLVDTSDEPDEIDTGRNRYAGRDEDMPNYYYSQNNYSQIVNTSNEPTRIGRNADGYQDQLNMQLNKILYN
jgi:hypothetical protein